MFTDFLGKPINEGDKIVFPVSGYGGPRLEHATVDKLVPLVDYPNRASWRVNRHNSVPTYAREDQLSKPDPTAFTGKLYEDPQRRFVVQIQRKVTGYGRKQDRLQKFTVPASEYVVVV